MAIQLVELHSILHVPKLGMIQKDTLVVHVTLDQLIQVNLRLRSTNRKITHCNFKIGCSVEDPDLQMRKKCFTRRADGSGFDKKGDSGCEDAELVERDGFLIQTGGPALPMTSACRKGWMFAMPYEVSFVLNFTVIDNLPRGCGLLDGEWRYTKMKPYKQQWNNKIYIGRRMTYNHFFIILMFYS